MSAPPEVTTRGRAGLLLSPRLFALAALALLLAHAGLVVIAVRNGAPGRPPWQLYSVIAVGAVMLRLLAMRKPEAAAGIALAGCGALAAALLGAGAVAVVALMVVNAAVVGLSFLAWAGKSDVNALTARGLAMPTAVGMALWVGLMAGTSALPVHLPLVNGLARSSAGRTPGDLGRDRRMAPCQCMGANRQSRVPIHERALPLVPFRHGAVLQQ